jgi:hypothetical protein
LDSINKFEENNSDYELREAEESGEQDNEDDQDDDDDDNHGGLTELVRDVVGEIFRSPLTPQIQL